MNIGNAQGSNIASQNSHNGYVYRHSMSSENMAASSTMAALQNRNEEQKKKESKNGKSKKPKTKKSGK